MDEELDITMIFISFDNEAISYRLIWYLITTVALVEPDLTIDNGRGP